MRLKILKLLLGLYLHVQCLLHKIARNPIVCKPKAKTPGMAPNPTAITNIIAIINSGIALKNIVIILILKTLNS